MNNIKEFLYDVCNAALVIGGAVAFIGIICFVVGLLFMGATSDLH